MSQTCKTSVHFFLARVRKHFCVVDRHQCLRKTRSHINALFLPVLIAFTTPCKLCFDELFDIFADLLRDEVPRVSFDRRSGGRNEKLLKVPRHVRSLHRRPNDMQRVGHQRIWFVMWRRERRFEPIKDGVSPFSVYETFLHEH